MMEDMTGVRAKEISLSDPVTMSIFTSPAALGLPDDDPIIGTTGTFGIPDFERSHTRQILMDAHPTSFDDLIHVSGLSHGVGAWENNAQNLIYNGIANVKETIGSRDDIMLYLLSVGIEPELAYRTMEDVRNGKVLKSGKFPGNAEQQMRDKGVPEWYIESMRKISYLFPKAHVAAYVMMAFRIAWFKVHEPLRSMRLTSIFAAKRGF
jgi:DNA polymerase-3 subunit alpha (Gram-positive type)